MQGSFNNKPSRHPLTLKHNFNAHEIPAEIHELTPDSLRELFDQAIHYGFPNESRAEFRTLLINVNGRYVKITASYNSELMMLSITSSRKKTFHMATSTGMMFWEIGLSVTDVMRTSRELDQIMERRGCFNGPLNSRTSLIEAKSFRAIEVFPIPYIYYALPIQRTYDLRELFSDQSNTVAAIRLHGRDIACKLDEIDEISRIYRPTTEEEIRRGVEHCKNELRAQLDPKRYS